MKISKTLRGVIENHYKMKSRKIRDKYYDIIENETSQMRDEILSDEMYVTIIDLNKKLTEKYIDREHVTLRFGNSFFKEEPIHWSVAGVRFDEHEGYVKEMNELDSETQRLFLELEYEKDLSELNSILEKFGVEI